MQNFYDIFETRKRSFISAFSICMTVPLNHVYRNKSGVTLHCAQFRISQIIHFNFFLKATNIEPLQPTSIQSSN